MKLVNRQWVASNVQLPEEQGHDQLRDQEGGDSYELEELDITGPEGSSSSSSAPLPKPMSAVPRRLMRDFAPSRGSSSSVSMSLVIGGAALTSARARTLGRSFVSWCFARRIFYVVFRRRGARE